MLNLDNIIDFPTEKVGKLLAILRQEREQLKPFNLYINEIIREDIFNILDHYCTVVYYPLLDEKSNDGFHVTMPVDYNEKGEEHFVFLNTAKPREKQVFAAAHELGHILVPEDSFWDDELEKILPRNKENVDAVMNRFAAELLMPTDVFCRSANNLFERFISADGTVLDIDAFRMITSLMDEFCVPAQAVICRFYEAGLLDKGICQELLTGPANGGFLTLYSDFFDDMIKKCVKEGGYTNLLKRSEKVGIKDFPEVLNEMEREDLFPMQKIEQLREFLNIPKIKEGKKELTITPIIIGDIEQRA